MSVVLSVHDVVDETVMENVVDILSEPWLLESETDEVAVPVDDGVGGGEMVPLWVADGVTESDAESENDDVRVSDIVIDGVACVPDVEIDKEAE